MVVPTCYNCISVGQAIMNGIEDGEITQSDIHWLVLAIIFLIIIFVGLLTWVCLHGIKKEGD